MGIGVLNFFRGLRFLRQGDLSVRFGVLSSGLRARDGGFRVYRLGCRVRDIGFQDFVFGSGSGILGLRVHVLG